MTQKNITMFCDEVGTSGVFSYSRPPGSPLSADCEPTWYDQSETVLGDEIPLILDFCETGLKLVIECFASPEKYEYNFQVTNRTTPDGLTGSTNRTVSDGRKHLCFLPVIVLLLLLVLFRVYTKCVHRPKHDGDNADHLTAAAATSPVKNMPENDGRARALTGHAHHMDDGRY